MTTIPFSTDSRFLQDVQDEALRFARKEYSFWASDEDCQMMVQNSMFTLFNKVHNGTLTELTCNLKTYVIGILKRIAKNQASKKSKQPLLTFENGEVDELDPIDFAMTSVALERWQDKENDEFQEQLQEEVRKLVENMDDPCKTILWSYYWEGKKMKEIADVLNYSGKDVAKSQKSRCMTKVKEAMIEIRNKLRS